MDTYYDPKDLAHFPDIGKDVPELWQKFLDWYNAVFAEGALWDGRLYDCDFNQMLDLGLGPRSPQTIFEASLDKLVNRVIQIGQHCFGCTAGLGSS
jgi:hypothetical protein